MFGILCLAWFRRQFGIKTFDEDFEKKIKRKTTLKEWREKTIEQWSELHKTDDEPSPYNTYFFDYCQYCSRFKSEHCFDKDGFIFKSVHHDCAKLRLTNVLLHEAFVNEEAAKEDD